MDRELINIHCLVDFYTQHANLTFYLGGYVWAVSSLATEQINIWCLEETYLETTVPLITLIYIGIGCESYSTNIYIPSKTDLTTELDGSIWHKFFLSFNAIYHNMAEYGICYELKLETLTQKEKIFLVSNWVLPNGFESFK